MAGVDRVDLGAAMDGTQDSRNRLEYYFGPHMAFLCAYDKYHTTSS